MKTFVLTLLFILTPLTTNAASLNASTIHTLVNKERTAQGVAPLERSPALDAVAQSKLNDMVANKYFAHTSPAGKNFKHWFNVNSYLYTYAGENLARYFTTEKATVKGWMASPTHKSNIMKPQYTDTGIAVKGDLVVQVFAKPQ